MIWWLGGNFNIKHFEGTKSAENDRIVYFSTHTKSLTAKLQKLTKGTLVIQEHLSRFQIKSAIFNQVCIVSTSGLFWAV